MSTATRLAAALVATALAGCASLPGGTPRTGTAAAEAAPPPTTQSRAAEIQTQLGLGYLRENRLESAFSHLQRAVAHDPGFSTAHMSLALVYEQLGELGKAERHFERAVNVNGRDSAARNNYGRFLCQTDRHEAGLAQLETALGNPLYDGRLGALVNAGVCAMNEQDGARAEAYLREALGIDPRLPPALGAMAQLSYDTGRPLSTRAYLERHAAVTPLPPGLLLLGVRAERALGADAAADEYASRLRATYPDSSAAGELEREGER